MRRFKTPTNVLLLQNFQVSKTQKKHEWFFYSFTVIDHTASLVYPFLSIGHFPTLCVLFLLFLLLPKLDFFPLSSANSFKRSTFDQTSHLVWLSIECVDIAHSRIETKLNRNTSSISCKKMFNWLFFSLQKWVIFFIVL